MTAMEILGMIKAHTLPPEAQPQIKAFRMQPRTLLYVVGTDQSMMQWVQSNRMLNRDPLSGYVPQEFHQVDQRPPTEDPRANRWTLFALQNIISRGWLEEFVRMIFEKKMTVKCCVRIDNGNTWREWTQPQEAAPMTLAQAIAITVGTQSARDGVATAQGSFLMMRSKWEYLHLQPVFQNRIQMHYNAAQVIPNRNSPPTPQRDDLHTPPPPPEVAGPAHPPQTFKKTTDWSKIKNIRKHQTSKNSTPYSRPEPTTGPSSNIEDLDEILNEPFHENEEPPTPPTVSGPTTPRTSTAIIISYLERVLEATSAALTELHKTVPK